MKEYVVCRNAGKGLSSFHLLIGNEEYYLFTQEFRRGTADYFRCGVVFDNAIDTTKGHYDTALLRTMKKILSAVRYVEKEYGIAVLKRSRNKNSISRRAAI